MCVACQNRMQCAWTTDAALVVVHLVYGLHVLQPVVMGFAVVFWLVPVVVPFYLPLVAKQKIVSQMRKSCHCQNRCQSRCSSLSSNWVLDFASFG